MNDSPGFPMAPLLATVVCVALVNVVAAQAIVAAAGSGDGFRLGAGIVVMLCVVAIFSGVVAVRGWRGYLREQRRLRERPDVDTADPSRSTKHETE
jgi:hypothetical protein